jgi:hypothetical protein
MEIVRVARASIRALVVTSRAAVRKVWRMRLAALVSLSGLCLASCNAPGAGGASAPAELTRLEGFLPLLWDARAGKMWLELERFDQDLLYVESLPAGLGSNDVGLDRGQIGKQFVVRFVRSGPKVLLVAPNLGYRAEFGSVAERAAVADSFAQSVLFGFDVAEEHDGRVRVDATGFFLRDAHDVAGTLRQTGQGSFALDPSRSAFHLPMTKNFPKNTEVEVWLTFAGSEPGGFVRDVTPEPTAITVRQRHSLVELPGPGYTPRAFDPRAGYYPTGFQDYSVPIAEPIQRQFLTRHRLIKKDPQAERSEPVEPIVYYLDPATPEPIRSALLDGARWWSQAFEAAGWIDAYRVELLPADADPLDVRYNVIQWVHRATRGWSYGGGVTDPRTGEIIKGHVSLGSLRVRQDYLIATGLLSPFEEGVEASPEAEAMALARLRQLSAHEVGHTLGLAHNYLSSTAARASVMDYPHPLATLRADGSVDLSDAYGTEIGAWDEVAIDYGYREFAPGADERAELARILAEARARGLTFLTDQDARPLGSAHPATHLWDNGPNAIDEFERLLELRRAALARFGPRSIPAGRPLATLEEALVPLYLMHRYQLEAVAKSVGGVRYSYALRGDGQVPLEPVPPAEQRRALAALLGALAPEHLTLSPELLLTLPPRPEGFPRHRELFANRTDPAFDALAPAEALAVLTFRALLEPARAERLVQQHALDPTQPGLEELLTTLLAATWRAPTADDCSGEIARTIDAVALVELLTLALHPATSPAVRARIDVALMALVTELARIPPTLSSGELAHQAWARRLLERFFMEPSALVLPTLTKPPPGAPI